VRGDVFAIAHGAEKLVASLQGTMICKRHQVASED
jgi:hypothetical protein